MVSRKVVMNAFRPATEVDEPELFAGRAKQVRELVDALHMLGSVPLIYGDRGLGKSSLALQIQRIAMGDVELLDELGMQSLALDASDQFLTFYVTCTAATKRLPDLLQMLINSAESVEFTAVGNGGKAKQLVDRTTRRKLTLKVVELESTKNYKTAAGRLSYQDLNQEEKLTHLCQILSDSYDQPVLFVIDELDKMGNTAGLASFLKAVSSDQLKFVLVGIASNHSELLSDHQSLERRLVSVNVPLMSTRELMEIVTNAEEALRSEGSKIEFDTGATRRLVQVSAGFPWFVHVVGQTALLAAHDRGDDLVLEEDIAAAVLSIVSNRFAQQFADMYQNAVRDSYSREVVLRSFAHWRQRDIPTGEVYAKLKKQLDVSNPSVYRGHLCQKDFGPILYTPVFQRRGLVRFRNEMFKAYVRMRPSIYQDVDELVAEVWS